MKRKDRKGDITKAATDRKHRTIRGRELAKLSLDPRGYPTGKDGTVWATFDLWQAEIVRNTLLAQHIACELGDMKLDGKTLNLLRVADERGLEEAMDFIWRDKGGLRLMPDWSYPKGSPNRSFEQWLSGQ